MKEERIKRHVIISMGIEYGLYSLHIYVGYGGRNRGVERKKKERKKSQQIPLPLSLLGKSEIKRKRKGGKKRSRRRKVNFLYRPFDSRES